MLMFGVGFEWRSARGNPSRCIYKVRSSAVSRGPGWGGYFWLINKPFNEKGRSDEVSDNVTVIYRAKPASRWLDVCPGYGAERDTGDGEGVELPHRGMPLAVTVWAENRRNNCSSSGSRRGVETFSRYSSGTNWLAPARESPMAELEFWEVDEARERVVGDGELEGAYWYEDWSWFCDWEKEDPATLVEREECGRGPAATLLLMIWEVEGT